MTNPVLVEVTRGAIVESRHRGAVAVVDAGGRRVAAHGDVTAPVFPRSAVKAIQALPLVESGAADAYGFGAAELALASASHSGEPRHVETAAAMLAAAGKSAAELECGAHAPMSSLAERILIRAGHPPGPLHNNCSGKHAGFICTACHLGIDPKGYVLPDHPVQREVTAALADLTGTELGEANRGVDGCSIPAYAIPLERLARAFAIMATGKELAPVRAAAAKRILEACMTEPFMVAGSGRFCTDVMPLFPGRVFVKGGAEGVYCAAFPEAGLGVALKIDDGAGRASEVAMAAVIAALLLPAGAVPAAFARRLVPPVNTRRETRVGELRAAPEFLNALTGELART
ncbi:MAG TPA: asparaginase [Bauldia sp.]|nr:asparaginase [Bauldia sp.]